MGLPGSGRLYIYCYYKAQIWEKFPLKVWLGDLDRGYIFQWKSI